MGSRGTVVRLACAMVVTIAFAVVATVPSAGAATPAPVVVGDMCSCSGPLAGASITSQVMHAWAAWVNAHGGLDGHKVTLVVKDDGFNPGNGVANVKDLLGQPNLIAIADNSQVASAWLPYVRSAHIPVVGLGGTYDYPGYFVAGTTLNNYYSGIAYGAKRLAVKKFALLVCAEVAACTGSEAPQRAALEKVGIDLSYFTTISYAAPNYTAECLAAKESGATGIEVGDAATVIQHVLEDCGAQGYRPKLAEALTIYNNWTGVPAFNGTVAMLATYPWPFRTAVTKTMYAALAKYAPGTASSPEFSGTTEPAWVDGVMIERALQLSNARSNVTAANVLAGMDKFNGETLGGLIPPTTFHAGESADNSCGFFLGIKNGRFVASFGLRPICF